MTAAPLTTASSLPLVNNNTTTNGTNNYSASHPQHAHLNLNYIHIHRNFSPMAALSRSPSCSSSPAVLSLGSTTSISTYHRRSLIPLPTVPGSASVQTNSTQVF